MRSESIRAVLACCVALLLAPAAARAVGPVEALALLNAQRAANGIPGDVVHAPGLSDGCAKHGAYIALNGGALAQDEDPAKPGYTPEGARQTLASSGPQALSSDTGWSQTQNPWVSQPIALYRLFDPEVAAAGYDDAHGVACMRVAGGRAPATAPELYSLPGNASTGVPVSALAREQPSTPQQLAGLPADQPTGPNVLLFTRGVRRSAALTATAFSLTGPQGPVDARLVTESSSGEAGGGGWFRGGGVLVPVAPLAPYATYVARVVWHRDAEAGAPAADVEQVVGFETAGLPNTIDVAVATAGVVNVVRVSTPAPNPTLTLTGPDGLTDVVSLTNGEARYDDLDPGPWQACASSGGRAVGFLPAAACKPFTASGLPRLALPRRRGRTSVELTVPRVADGRRARVTLSRYRRSCRTTKGRKRCAIQAVGRAKRFEMTLRSPHSRVRLPPRRPGVTVRLRVVLPAFTVGDAPYLQSEVRRAWS